VRSLSYKVRPRAISGVSMRLHFGFSLFGLTGQNWSKCFLFLPYRKHHGVAAISICFERYSSIVKGCVEIGVMVWAPENRRLRDGSATWKAVDPHFESAASNFPLLVTLVFFV
jgi:hypothetical protein